MGNIEKQLETFREKFPLTKVTVHDDFLAYNVKRGYQVLAAELANELIEKLDMPLVAIPDTFVTGNSFVVKSNETSDI